MNVQVKCLIKLNILIFVSKFRHRYVIPCRGGNVNILSLDLSKCKYRQQTDGSICPTVRIEVGNFTSMVPLALHATNLFMLNDSDSRILGIKTCFNATIIGDVGPAAAD